MFIVRNDSFNFSYYLCDYRDDILVWDRSKDKAKIFIYPDLREIFLEKNYIFKRTTPKRRRKKVR